MTSPPFDSIATDGTARDPAVEALEAALELVQRLARAVGTLQSGTVVPEPWLTPEQGADYAAVSPDTMRRWLNSGRLRFGGAGKLRRVRRSDIDAFLLGQAEVVADERRHAEERISQRAREIIESIRRKG